MKKIDYYKVLGVPHNASYSEIRDAFYRKALESHPDLSTSATAEKDFAILKEAFDALRNKDSRKVYDKKQPLDLSEKYTEAELKEKIAQFRAFQQELKKKKGDTRLSWFQRQPKRLVLLLAPLLVAGAFYFLNPVLSTDNYDKYDDLMLAWFNPRTQQWEPPDLSNPLYEANKRTQMRVPRKDVVFAQDTTPPMQ